MSEQKNLFNALLNGDSKGILKIYKLIFPSVRKYISTNSGSLEDAEDIFQKALIQITTKHKVKKLEPITNFTPYLYGVCKNLWLKELRKRKKHNVSSNVFEVSDEVNTKQLAIEILENDRWELYLKNFNLLSDNCKKVLALFFKKTKQKEIAHKFGYASETVVRQRIFKCKSKLIKLIKEDDEYQKLKNL